MRHNENADMLFCTFVLLNPLSSLQTMVQQLIVSSI